MELNECKLLIQQLATQKTFPVLPAFLSPSQVPVSVVLDTDDCISSLSLSYLIGEQPRATYFLVNFQYLECWHFLLLPIPGHLNR